LTAASPPSRNFATSEASEKWLATSSSKPRSDKSDPWNLAPSRETEEERVLERYLNRQFAALGEYNYRVFFLGQSVSLIGTWMQTIGQGWLVLQLTRSPTALGVVTLLQMLPFTALSLIGGVLADRLPKRKTLIALQSFALAQAIVMLALVASGRVEIWHIYCLAFALGLTNAIERPTRQSFFSELVPKDRLVNAVALNSSILNLARILGPALGGLMIALVGVEGTFAFNAFSFLAVLCGYALMRPERFYAPRRPPVSASLFREIGVGIRYAVGTPAVVQTLILVAAIGTFGYNFNVIVPLIAEFVLDVGPQRFGVLTSCLGAGSFIASFAIAGLGKQSTATLFGGAAAFSILFMAASLSTSYWLTAGLLFGLGISGVSLMTMANTSLQLDAPEELRGRIISIFVLLQASSTPIGALLTGLLSDRLGVRPAMTILGVLCAFGVGAALTYRAANRGRLELPPDPVPAPKHARTEPVTK
jgi:MFS family permease